ncbi:hypothetical protein R3I93_008681 [Phoxinus phoxinus]|uniref:Uncharacterized protein n=1 Tax=Phoxinus phoxinus TaxID=58324 RepID=A0AAN9D2Z9_9TELE
MQASHASIAGDLRYSIVFPKFKHGEFTVRALKSNPTTGYIDKLMELLFHHVVETFSLTWTSLDKWLYQKNCVLSLFGPTRRQ